MNKCTTCIKYTGFECAYALEPENCGLYQRSFNPLYETMSCGHPSRYQAQPTDPQDAPWCTMCAVNGLNILNEALRTELNTLKSRKCKNCAHYNFFDFEGHQCRQRDIEVFADMLCKFWEPIPIKFHLNSIPSNRLETEDHSR